jgi:GntR family transcriptional regulator
MKKIGKEPTSRVLSFKIKSPGSKAADVLEIDRDSKVYEFTRLRLADGEPMMLETTYIPYNCFEGITEEGLETTPLYDILIKKYGTVFSKAEEIFRPTLLTEEEADKLHYIDGGPAIMLERITYDGDHNKIEYTKSVARGDKFEYRVVLEK